MTDRRFGVHKFGDGSLFGPSDATQALAWGVEVDWDQDGFFTGANEGRYMTGININRGRQSFVRPNGHGFVTISTGTAKITLRNYSDRYNGLNTASDLYPYVAPGGDVRIIVRDLNGAPDPYPLFYGILIDVQLKEQGREVELTIEDGLRYLSQYVARVAMQTDIAPDAALSAILDYIGWPTRWGRNLDASGDNIKYFWASGGKTAKSTIEDIVQSFLGYFFVNASGQARYINRSDVDVTILNLDEAQLLKEIPIPQPFENSRNVTRIKAHPRTAAAPGTVWQLLGNTPSVQAGAGNALPLFIDYTYNNAPVPVTDIIQPVATTDFLMNTAPDGSGTNKTADCTVVWTNFGDTGKLLITNNSGVTVYVTFLKVRATAIYEQNSSDVTYPPDASTVTQPREFFLDLPWQQDINVAVDFSNLVGPFIAGSNIYPSVFIEQRPELQFAVDLFDITVLNSARLSIDGSSFRIAGIIHRSINTDNCQSILTRLFLEPYISGDDYWTFDVSVFDTDIFGA